MATATHFRRSIPLAVAFALFALSVACSGRPQETPRPRPPVVVEPSDHEGDVANTQRSDPASDARHASSVTYEASVRPDPDAPLSPADLAAIHELWRATLVAISTVDRSALRQLHAPCHDGEEIIFYEADPDRASAMASRWDASGLWLGPISGNSIDAMVGPPGLANPGLRLRKASTGEWGLCAFLMGQ